MTVKKPIINDIIKRNRYIKNEFILRTIKILIRLKTFNLFDLLNSMSIEENNPFNIINNRCYITSRNSSIYNKVRLSRIKFKEFINNGLLIGFNKYSW